MKFCPNCTDEGIFKIYASKTHVWYSCDSCQKMISYRVQAPRGSRRRAEAFEMLTECSGEIIAIEYVGRPGSPRWDFRR